MTTTPLYSLSISARATLDLHSLNNEGGEGNQVQTRMVNVVDENGDLHNVNAISGDMFKHIQAEHLFHIARGETNLPLCAGCREFNANRINADADFIVRTKGMSDAATIDEMLGVCAQDDIEGILITEGNRSLPRKSAVEFGWVVGVPGSVETDSYFHVKYSSQSRAKTAESREAESKAGSNLGQAIFHRPASSGIYAIVCHVELARIGFNDITQEYAIDADERQRRARALLQSVLYTFLQPRGAMRSAQAPHLVNFEGVVSLSAAPVPAPTISPLKTGYGDQVKHIVGTLERVAPGAVGVMEFGDLNGFTQVIADLLETTVPFELRYR